jgi:hypothetical protein
MKRLDELNIKTKKLVRKWWNFIHPYTHTHVNDMFKFIVNKRNIIVRNLPKNYLI